MRKFHNLMTCEAWDHSASVETEGTPHRRIRNVMRPQDHPPYISYYLYSQRAQPSPTARDHRGRKTTEGAKDRWPAGWAQGVSYVV